MELLSRGEIERLSRFHKKGFLITSLYLDTDKSRLTKKEINLTLKNLSGDAFTRIEKMALSKEQKDSLDRDLKKIVSFCSQKITATHSPGLSIFSCSDADFWREIQLPHPPRNRIIFDQNAYVRPLSAILGRYRNTCVFLVSRRESKWYQVYMGAISPLESLVSNVPSKVREGGFEGYESKRIERHIEAHLLEHFKKSAQITFDFFKKNPFEWLFLGCEESSHSDLEPLLHSYLKDRLKGRLKAKPSDPPSQVLKEALALELKLEKQEEESTVQKLVSEVEKGGLAVAGVKETLQRLNRAEVQTFVVTHNFSVEGKICPSCKFLYLEETTCPSCRKKTEPVIDVIDEAIERAMAEKCSVKHVNSPSRLDRFGKIGATLRYRT